MRKKILVTNPEKFYSFQKVFDMKIALVTGGGTGIGRAAAIELNKIDFEVYVIGRREKELKETLDRKQKLEEEVQDCKNKLENPSHF